MKCAISLCLHILAFSKLNLLPTDRLHNEKDLLSLIAKGDDTGFTTLFRFYRNRVYSVAHKITHSSYISEEIVQDVFLKIWLKRTDLTEVRDFNAYLFIVTRNTVFRVLKRMAKEYKIISLTDEEQVLAKNDTTDLVMEKEFNTLLQNAVDRLPNQQKKVYKYIKEQGLKREEVADLLHLQPDTVKFHLSQALKNIRSFCMLRLNLLLGLTALLLALLGNK